jgi:hypothetical protein
MVRKPSPNLAPKKNHLYDLTYKWLIMSVARGGDDPPTS